MEEDVGKLETFDGVENSLQPLEAGTQNLTSTISNNSWSIERLIEFFEIGGPVSVILLVLSIVALTVTLMKLWQFCFVQLNARKFIEPALSKWKDGDYKSAEKILTESRSPIARVMQTAMYVINNKYNAELGREEVLRVATNEMVSARRYLKVLDLIATLSPLLGLLGTVFGMIEAFKRLEEAGSTVDPSILSGGIWEALLTTAMGLSVAIPVVFVLGWFEQRIAQFQVTMEDAMTRVFTLHTE